ncbi:hypothetical protein AAC387_Pa05g1471 [Persea americana]
MPRNRDEAAAVRVYTVCDESRYLIVRNVPALGCGDELQKLFGSYGEIEECKPMDAEECEPFTDVYWIKFVLVSNARFAKRKLDEYVFLGNQLQVSYAPHFESLADTKEKLEVRRKEVLGRINTGILQESNPRISNHPHNSVTITKSLPAQDQSWTDYSSQHLTPKQREFRDSSQAYHMEIPSRNRVSSNEDYFSSPSMNETVRVVREKLDKIQASGKSAEAGPACKKTRVDNRRRI